MAQILQTGTLIITLDLGPEEQVFFNSLREKHFPAHANYLDAHITLFHKLPANEASIPETLTKFAERPQIELTVNKVHLMGTCVAYTLVSDELKKLHEQMQKAFEPWLIKQDQQALRPHITVQNKVTAFKAQQLHQELNEGFTPFTIKTIGFSTWKYLKGPWKLLAQYPFYK
ncbi:2'-5' RNA ligase family protein [Chitinophaga sancti]|uniref:2'-5' RNA ligase family protein n=1 Tax=Chitinophaga sancti TaxID=1004 RepID=UPI003F7A21CE